MGKRADGYHQLASLFQAIDLGDTLTFTPSSHDSLTCSDPTLPTDQSNLVVQAHNLFRKKTGIKTSLAIHIEKQIPTQAGLGGGSSNAATTLWALNALHGHQYPIEALQQWGTELGSDVPFFFSSGTAYCTGRGECVRDLPPLPPLGTFSLIKPPMGLSTKEIYGALNIDECASHDPEELLERFFAGSPLYINDLENPVFKRLPELQKLKEQLNATGATDVMMTGSGTAFFYIKEERSASITFLRRPAPQWYSLPASERHYDPLQTKPLTGAYLQG